MMDLLLLVIGLGLPWLAGTMLVRLAGPAPRGPIGMLELGYGYFVGIFLATLLLRLWSLFGIAWKPLALAVPLVVVAGIGAYLTRAQGAFLARPVPAWWSGSGALRAACLVLLGLTALRAVLLGLETWWLPLLPLDTWSQWGSKAQTWYAYGSMVPFVSFGEWTRATSNMVFTDVHPQYPGTVPLLQVWSALWIGRWDESLVNAAWAPSYVALGLAFHAQLRRLAVGSVAALTGTYLLLSLPFLTVHVGLAGLADLHVAIAWGLAAIALWQWASGGDRRDGALALVMAAMCATVKLEGMIWALVLVPGLVAAKYRVAATRLTALAAAAAGLFLAFGPKEIRIFTNSLSTEFENVSLPIFQHLFVMDNWHLLWYATLAIVVACRRQLLAVRVTAATLTMATAFGFVFVVFYFSSASGGVDDESLTNRLILHMVPALVFYLALLLRERVVPPVPMPAAAAEPMPAPSGVAADPVPGVPPAERDTTPTAAT